jgi:SAM-dependent methyltransferase
MMQGTLSQLSYWDRVAHEKRFSHPLRLDWLEHYLQNPQAGILDYGCGYGRTLAELAVAGYENLVGVDFSEAMLARSRVQVPGPSLIRNDGRGLPFKDDCFDAVLLFAVLTCIPDDNEQRLLLAEAQRVLWPGGLLYVETCQLQLCE